jgi:hypothetical protein
VGFWLVLSVRTLLGYVVIASRWVYEFINHPEDLMQNVQSTRKAHAERIYIAADMEIDIGGEI